MASETSRSAPTSAENRARPRLPWLVPAVLLALTAVLLFMRLHTYTEPLESDITTYAVIAHELLKGRPLYTDLWDIKPPLIFWTYAGAELAAGYGTRSVFLLNVLASVATLVGSYFAAREVSGRRLGGLLAALCWTLISGDLVLQGNQPNAEVFINTALVWGLYFATLALRVAPARQSRVLAGAGVCFAVACLYKQVVLVIPLLLAAVLATLFRREGQRKLRPFALLLLPSIVAWVLTAGYFMAKGSFAEFYQTLVDMGAAYARNTSVGATPEWRSVLPAGTRFLLLPLSAGLLGAALVRERRPQWALLIAHILASAVVVALPNKYFQHYFQLYLSPVAIVAGAGLAALNGDGRRWLVPRIAGIAVVLAWLGWRELPFYRLPADEWSRAKYGPLYVDIRELSGKINSVLAPGETFYEYGNESGFYFYTRRTPPSGMISNFGLVDGPYKLQYDRQVIQQLDKAVPEMTIVAKYMARGPVTDWIAERYIMIWQSDTFVILARRNGKLEQRLAAK